MTRNGARGRSTAAQGASWKDEDEEWTVDCPCGVKTDDGQPMIECEVCNVWAHIRCIGEGKDVQNYTCASCSQVKLVPVLETEHAELVAPDAGSLRLARAQVHAEAEASKREVKEATNYDRRSISSKVCWDALGLAPKLLGDRRQAYLATLERESIERARTIPPPKPNGAKNKKDRKNKTSEDCRRCPKAMKRAAWQEFRKEEAAARSLARSLAKAAIQSARELEAPHETVVKHEMLEQTSSKICSKPAPGLSCLRCLSTTDLECDDPTRGWVQCTHCSSKIHKGCLSKGMESLVESGEFFCSNDCREMARLRSLPLRSFSIKRQDSGNSSPTTTLHQHSEVHGSTEDERSSDKDELTHTDETVRPTTEMDSAVAKHCALNVEVVPMQSGELPQVDFPIEMDLEEEIGLGNLDTSGMNDEELAMYLHHQLNAPSSRRKSRRLPTSSSMAGSPVLKRKRSTNLSSPESRSLSVEDSPKLHKSDASERGFAPHLFRTATS